MHLWNKYIIVTLGSSYHWRRQEKLDHSSTKMNHAEKVFNPRHHPSDIQTAFTRFVKKFGYTYNGENRTVPTAIVNTPATAAITNASADWKEKDKAKLFLSRAVSEEFLDDYEAAVSEAERTDIKFDDLVTKMKDRYAPTSNKVMNHYKFHRIVQNASETFDDFTHRVKADALL